jgi:ABC-type lipoprotein release transport system permease subunit
MILKLAFRNIFRQKRRTLLTSLTMFGGFALCSFSIAWMDGTYNNIIDMFTRNELGHIQIHEKDYLDRPALYRTVDDYESIGRTVEQIDRVEGWAPRLYAAGLASVGSRTAGVRIIGVDPSLEAAATNFDRKVHAGPGLSPTAAREALLGKGLAKRLEAGIGDEVVIVSQAADGSIANDLYTVAGVVDSGNEMGDQMSLYLHLADAQELFVLEGRVHEIAITSNSIRGLYGLAGRLAAAIESPQLAVEPWQVFAKTFYDAMKADQKGNWISLAIITLLVAIGVLNTVLMTVLERTREYGLMRAIGTSPWMVFRLVLTEVSIMAVMSVIAGAAIATAVNYWLSINGIAMPVSFDFGGMTFSHAYTEINTRSYVIPLLSVVLSAVLISVFPALKAARTQPAAAMRYH